MEPSEGPQPNFSNTACAKSGCPWPAVDAGDRLSQKLDAILEKLALLDRKVDDQHALLNRKMDDISRRMTVSEQNGGARAENSVGTTGGSLVEPPTHTTYNTHNEHNVGTASCL
ncbi:hypothetical protein G6O67_001930 [Ophiocordyceps sinensis]|uniref:Uncharacterized protein n=1 Tax=Ophiocordyceps sinensis TaxID=72228 RepID=A0A8H4PTC6_9HYPO|nr:hypothetical protein G6O67_001930 [Ophiocordyceps sinensis]